MRGDQDVLSGYQDRLVFTPPGSLSRALAQAAPRMAAAQQQQAELQARTPARADPVLSTVAAPDGLVVGEAVQMATPVGPRRATVLSVDSVGMVRLRDEDGEVFAIAADKQGRSASRSAEAAHRAQYADGGEATGPALADEQGGGDAVAVRGGGACAHARVCRDYAGWREYRGHRQRQGHHR